MDLKEKFKMFFIAYGLKKVSDHYSEQCEKIANEHAIKFNNWVNENAYKFPTSTTTEELLEIYNKQQLNPK